MKMTKKVLFGAAVLAVASFGFFGCSEPDNDPNEIWSGSNKTYTANKTNETSDIIRGFNTTTFKHLGELVQITFDNQTTSSHDGVLGFIWDLQQSKDAAKVTEGTTVTEPAVTAKGQQNFFVIGFRNNGAPSFYISKYFNVTDEGLQDDNFGAGSTDTVTTHKAGIAAATAKELVVKTWTTLPTTGFKVNTTDNTLTFWVDIYPVYSGSDYGVDCAAHASDDAGSYVVDIYASDPTAEGATFDATTKVSTVIGTDKTGYTAKPSQQTLAVYANVQPNKTLTGTENLAKDYAEAEVLEDDAE